MNQVIAAIRKKYPDAYQNVSDDDLAVRVAERYPTYLRFKDFADDVGRTSRFEKAIELTEESEADKALQESGELPPEPERDRSQDLIPFPSGTQVLRKMGLEKAGLRASLNVSQSLGDLVKSAAGVHRLTAPVPIHSAADVVSKFGRGMAESAAEEAEGLGGGLKEKAIGMVAGGVASSLPSLLMALTPLGLGGAATVAGLQEAGSVYEDALAAGASKENATKAAVLSGVFSGGATKVFGGSEKFLAELSKNIGKTAGKEILKGIATSVGTEAPEEFFQTWNSELAKAKYYGDPDKPLFFNERDPKTGKVTKTSILTDALTAAAVGGASALLIGGIGGGVQAIAAQPKEADVDQKDLKREVPSGQPEGQEPGRVPDQEGGDQATPTSGILSRQPGQTTEEIPPVIPYVSVYGERLARNRAALEAQEQAEDATLPTVEVEAEAIPESTPAPPPIPTEQLALPAPPEPAGLLPEQGTRPPQPVVRPQQLAAKIQQRSQSQPAPLTDYSPEQIEDLSRSQLIDELRGLGITKVGGRNLIGVSNQQLKVTLNARTKPVRITPTTPEGTEVQTRAARVKEAEATPVPVKPATRKASLRGIASDIAAKKQPVVKPANLRALIQQRSRSKPTPLQETQASVPATPTPEPTPTPATPVPSTTEAPVVQPVVKPQDLARKIQERSRSKPTPPIAPEVDSELAGDIEGTAIGYVGVKSIDVVDNLDQSTIGRPTASGATATISADGRVVFHRGRLKAALDSTKSPGARKRLLKSIINEEVFHILIEQHMAPGDVEGVWNSLNQQEQQELLNLYAQGRTDLTPYQLGHEYIRRLLQVKVFGLTTESAAPGSTLFNRVNDKVNQFLRKLVALFRQLVGTTGTDLDQKVDMLAAALRDNREGVYGLPDAPAPASLPRALELLAEARSRGRPAEEVANLEENVRLEQAGEVVGHIPAIQANIADLQSIVEQRNRRGDVRVTGPALVQMKVFQSVLTHPIVQKFMYSPVLRLEESIAALGRATTTYFALKDDPDTTPELLSAASMAVQKTLDAWYVDTQGFKASYDTTVSEQLDKLKEALTAKEEAQAQRAEAEVLYDDLLEISKGLVSVTRDRGMLQARRTAEGNSSAVKNTLQFVTQHVNLGRVGKTLTTTQEVFDLISSASNAQGVSKGSVEQTVGANEETIRSVASFILASQALRDRIAKANNYILGKSNKAPLSKFKDALVEAIDKGNVAAALRIFASGIGDTAIARSESMETAQFYKNKEQQILIDLQAMEVVLGLINGVEQSPEFQAVAEEITQKLNARLETKSIYGNRWRFAAVNPGEEDLILSNSSTSGVEQLRLLSEWMQSAMLYAGDSNSPNYDPVRANGYRAIFANRGVELDPNINPEASKLLPSGPKKLVLNTFSFLRLGGLDRIPKFLIGTAVGYYAEQAGRAMNAYSTMDEQKISISKHWNPKINIALRKALDSHQMGDDIVGYEDQIYNPIAASLQYFSNPKRFSAGKKLGNGMTVTKEDMEFFTLVKQFEKVVIDTTNGVGERTFQSIKLSPTGVRYKRGDKWAFRQPVETGPGTVHRRLSKMVEWYDTWANGNKAARIKFINRNLHRILHGYIADASNPNFSSNYRFREEFNEIWDNKGDLVTSFDDLVSKVLDHSPTNEDEELLTADEIEAIILGEIDGHFKRWKSFHADRDENAKSILWAWGGENSFNTERGQQIVPSTWYDYGSVSLGQRLGFLHNSTVGFAVEYYHAIEALEGSLAETVREFEAGKRDKGVTPSQIQSASREAQLEGQNYYNWGEAKTLLADVAQFRDNLEKALKFQVKQPITGFLKDVGLGGGLDYVVASMLISPVTEVVNAIGGVTQMVLFNANLRNRSILAEMVRIGTYKPIIAFYRESINMLLNSSDPSAKELGRLLNSSQVIPIWEKLARIMGDQADLYKAELLKARSIGINLNTDLLAIIKSEAGFWRLGGRPAGEETRNPLLLAGRALETGTRMMAEVLRQSGVGWVDSRLNSRAAALVFDMEMDLMERAIRYGELREQRAIKEGRDPSRIEELRNRFSDVELVGGRLRHPTQSAIRFRQMLRREGQINIDFEMWQFYNRWKEAGKPDITKPDFLSKHGQLRLFEDPAVLNQLMMALSKEVNNATNDTRPIGLRTGKTTAILGLFLGYKSWANLQITSFADKESKKSWPEATVRNLPMMWNTIFTLAVLGSMAMFFKEKLKNWFFNRFSPYTHVFEKQSPKERFKAVLGGIALGIPFYGDIANMITGRVYRSGYDLNQMFLVVNMAVDVMATVKETLQTGHAVVPLIRLSSRWLFPMNLIGNRLPRVSGLNEVSQARNLMAKAGRQMDVEMKTYGGGGAMGRIMTESTGPLNDIMNAVGNKDIVGAKTAFDDLVKSKMKEAGGSESKAHEAALSALGSRNPVRDVFKRTLTIDEFEKMISLLPPEEAKKVQDILESYADTIVELGGRRPSFTEVIRAAPQPRGDPFGAGSLRDQFGRDPFRQRADPFRQ